MRLSISVCLRALWLFLLTIPAFAGGQKPVWQINLGPLQAKGPTDTVAIKFSGPFLLVYSGSGKGKHLRLVYGEEGRGRMATQLWDALSLPPWDECSRTEFRKAFPAVNLVDCRKKMVIEQVGGIGLGEVGEADFYLHEAGKAKVLLFRARKHCLPADPMFISDEYILLDEPCVGYIVVDKAGRKLYQIPKLWFAYLTVNRDGTCFASYERIDSIFHPFGGTQKIRVKVFRSEDGKKIFEYHWDLAADDSINDGRVTLSDDGSKVALVRGREILVFALPTSPPQMKAP